MEEVVVEKGTSEHKRHIVGNMDYNNGKRMVLNMVEN